MAVGLSMGRELKLFVQRVHPISLKGSIRDHIVNKRVDPALV